MKFYDMHVRAQAGAPAEELVKQAELLGYAGVVLVGQAQEQLSELKAAAGRLSSASMQVRVGIELQPRTSTELVEMLDKVRAEADLVIVTAGEPAVISAACQELRVDAVAPVLERPESGMDTASLETLARNGAAVEICFRAVLSAFRRQRAALLGRLIEIIRAAQEARAQIAVGSGAASVWELRDPRELIGLVNVLGLELPRAFAAVSDVPAQLAERRRK